MNFASFRCIFSTNLPVYLAKRESLEEIEVLANLIVEKVVGTVEFFFLNVVDPLFVN